MRPRTYFAALVLLPIFTAQACGPDFFPDVFVRKLRPDNPKQFAEGKLGILLPTFPRADLAVAFRYLNGGALASSERTAYQPIYTENEPEFLQQWDAEDTARAKYKPPSQTWSVVSIAYAPTPAEIDQDRSVAVQTAGGYTYQSQYLNCNDNAFETAVATLRARAKTWGEKSPELADWVKAQNAVFTNCDGKQPAMPAPAPPGSSALLQQDRAYQIAAAEFYAGHFDDARKSFAAIGQDANSPWRGLAQYLIARTLVRQAFLGANSNPSATDTFDPALMQQAAVQLRALLKDTPPGISRHAIQSQLDLVRIRIEPNARVRELAAALSGPATDPGYQQHLADLTWYLDNTLDGKPVREDTGDYSFMTPDQRKADLTPPPAQIAAAFSKEYVDLASLRSTAPLVDWLITWQSPAKEAAAHAVERWNSTHDLYWLVAAIAKATETDPAAPGLVSAAAQVPAASPAWESLTYHRVRLLIALGRSPEARDLLDQITPQLQSGGRDSTINAFRGLRMRAADTLNDLLLYAPQKVLLAQSESQSSLRECRDVMKNPKRVYDCIPKAGPMQFSDDAAGFLNTQAPLNTLAGIATSTALPDQLRRAVAMMAWTRAVLLKDDAAAARLFPLLPPRLQQQAGPGTGFRPVVTLVRNPGLRPFLDAGTQRSYSYDFVESYADNWWCADFQGGVYSETSAPVKKETVALLTEAERRQGELETASLLKQDGAAVYLGGYVLAYATSHPKDPAVPESLYLVLRMIRYGCDRWSDTPDQNARADKIAAIKKGASSLLRQRYAASPWTKKSAPFAG